MPKQYKPENYNSLSPYLIADNAEALIDFLRSVFQAKELRIFHHTDGKIAHAELKIDDTVLMLANSTDRYPAQSSILHLYVPDAFRAFDTAIRNGATEIEKPANQNGDPDIRGSFYDPAGNFWSVSSQLPG